MKTIGFDNYEEWIVDYFDQKLNAMQIQMLQKFVTAHPELNIELDETQWIELVKNDTAEFDQKDLLFKNEANLNVRFNELCFKKIEEINNVEEEKELAAMLLQNPKQAREWLLWLKTKLEIDVDIIYQFKEKLTKQFSETTNSDFEMWQVMDGERNENDSKVLIQQWESNPLLKTHWLAFQQSIAKPNFSIVYPNKDELKKETTIIPLLWRISLAAASVALLIGLWFTFSPNDKQTNRSLANKSNTLPNKEKSTVTNNKSIAQSNSGSNVQEFEDKQPSLVEDLIEPKPYQTQIRKIKPSKGKQIAFEVENRPSIAAMDLKTSNEIEILSLPKLVVPAPVAELNWAADMAFEEEMPNNKSKIWAFVRRQVAKRIESESFKLIIDKQELTQTADNALQRISKGTLRINTEKGKNSIALNRDIFKSERNVN